MQLSYRLCNFFFWVFLALDVLVCGGLAELFSEFCRALRGGGLVRYSLEMKAMRMPKGGGGGGGGGETWAWVMPCCGLAAAAAAAAAAALALGDPRLLLS